MITYDSIKSANERVNRMEISRYDKKTGKTVSKHYACVSERVQAFREICPDGCITTSVQLIPNENGTICLATAEVYDESGKMLARDNAYEREGSTQINSTSFVENACTSAVGRALGCVGLGSETSMASAEEMCNALYQQDNTPRATDAAPKQDDRSVLINLIYAAGNSLCPESPEEAIKKTRSYAAAIAERRGYSSKLLKDMTVEELKTIHNALIEKGKKK